MCKAFYQDLQIKIIIVNTEKELLSIIDDINNPNVVNTIYIMSHSISTKYIKHTLNKKKLKIGEFLIDIIFDESQMLKHHNSQISKTYKSFNLYIGNLLLLSGSLISNYPHQLYIQYLLLTKSSISYTNFINRYFR